MTRAARWEWAFAVDAVARGDLLLLLDDDRAARRPVDAGQRIWLLPSWRNERPAAVKRSWWPEVSRANRERPADGRVPLRCLCEVVASHALDDVVRMRIATLHPWSREHARSAERVLVVRAEARAEPRSVSAPQMDETYDELVLEPAEDGLLPALTDEAFALHLAIVEGTSEAGHASRG
ncbi:MAG: DUF1802 family protein [Gaiellales bacterium]